jgi:thioredoxin 1
MSEYVGEVHEGVFDQAVLKSKEPVLVDFWAQWWGPCRALAPIVEAIAEKYKGAARVFKLNVDDSPSRCATLRRSRNTNFDSFFRTK